MNAEQSAPGTSAGDAMPVGRSMTENNIARRVEFEMRRRGWSQERLAQEMTDAGCPLHQSAISKIINPRSGKRRTISVDEAIAFSKVFGVSFQELPLPLAVVYGRGVQTILARIEDLSAGWITATSNLRVSWDRLIDLLGDEAARRGYIEWSVEVERASADEAERALRSWAQRANEAMRDLGAIAVPDDAPADVDDLLAVRDFVRDIHAVPPANVERWVAANASALVRAGLSAVVAPLLNRHAVDRLVTAERVVVIRAVDTKIKALGGDLAGSVGPAAGLYYHWQTRADMDRDLNERLKARAAEERYSRDGVGPNAKELYAIADRAQAQYLSGEPIESIAADIDQRWSMVYMALRFAEVPVQEIDTWQFLSWAEPRMSRNEREEP